MTDLQPAKPSNNEITFRRLSDSQNEKLMTACLEILERTGVRLYDQEALDLLKEIGYRVRG